MITDGHYPTKRPSLLYTRSFAAVVWLCARGHEPTAEKARDGSGGLIWLFPAEAQDDLRAFFACKDKLNAMSLEAQQRS